MKLVLFCDYGLDDAAATLDALAHAERDGYEVDLVAVGGNVPADVALRNAKKLVANLSFPLPKVRIVDTTAIEQPAEYLASIHGGDGMGDLFEELPCASPVVPFSAWLEGLAEGFILVSLGPMTLVTYALEKKPARFLFMGGNVRETPNFHGYEFNHALNRKAFSACVSYPHIAITMDTCRHPLLNIQKEEIGESTLMRRIVGRSRELTFTSGEVGCYVWDDIAIKALRHPDWFETYEATDRDGNKLTVARYIHGKPYLEIIEE